MWNNKLKIAIATKNIQEIDLLINSMPEFTNLKEMEEAYHLIIQAKTLLELLKGDTLKEMNKIKASINFLKSSSHNEKKKFGMSFNV
ncbi:MAG: hypothetical protein U9N02_00410 [Campylobacterota bacterium]|nr:hypothetical protein [Campylobacterota bacterium]